MRVVSVLTQLTNLIYIYILVILRTLIESGLQSVRSTKVGKDKRISQSLLVKPFLKAAKYKSVSSERTHSAVLSSTVD